MGLRCLWIVGFLLIALEGRATNLGDPEDPLSLEVHGFVSQGFILTSDNNFLARSRDGSAEFAEVGLNFTKPLTDDLRVGVQLFTRDLGPVGNYDAKFDWFYLNYRFRDWLGFRAGRTKIPFGLYNEVQDIDSARVPILLPQSIYPTVQRDYLLAVTGAEAYGRVRLGDGGALEYRLYGGSIYLDAEGPFGTGYDVDLRIPFVGGGRLLWETPVEGLRVGGSGQTLSYDTDFRSPILPPVWGEVDAVLWVASVEYAAYDWLIAAEYSRWHAWATTSIAGLEDVESTSERGYAMLSYRMASWFQPSVYYSLFYPDTERRSGRSAYQHDLAVTARYDVNPYWLFKIEGHYMNGTAGLDPSLNYGTPVNQLNRHWGVFLAKTTAYF